MEKTRGHIVEQIIRPTGLMDPNVIIKPARGAVRLPHQHPQPKASFNPGVVDRLTRGDEPLAKVIRKVSPYPSHKGATMAHLEITEAGRAELRAKAGT